MIAAFTMPCPLYGPDMDREAASVTTLIISEAVDTFHIRKPDCPGAVASLVHAIPERLRHKLVAHSDYADAVRLGVGGLHLSLRNADESIPDIRDIRDTSTLFITRSCHSLEEICAPCHRAQRYQTLSPVFDSISKKGYKSRFNLENECLPNVLANRNVLALGGVTPAVFQKLSSVKFGGAALLGYLWQSERSMEEIINSIISARTVFDHT